MALSPVLLDYFDDRTSSSAIRELAVTFEETTFDDNKYGGNSAQPALVVGNSRHNRLVFRWCTFSNNDFVTNNTRVCRTNSRILRTCNEIPMD